MTAKYTQLSNDFKTKVILKKTESEKKIQEFEAKYYQDHQKLPSKTADSGYNHLLKEKNLATAILRNLDKYFIK